MTPGSIQAIISLLLTVLLSVCSVLLSKRPGILEEEIDELRKGNTRDGGWDIRTEIGLRCLCQHQLLALLKAFYRTLGFLYGVSLMILLLSAVSLSCLAIFNHEQFEKAYLQLALVILSITSAALMIIGLVPFVLSHVLTEQVRSTQSVSRPSTLRGPRDDQVEKYGR